MRKSTVFVSAILTIFLMAVLFGVVSYYESESGSSEDVVISKMDMPSYSHDLGGEVDDVTLTTVNGGYILKFQADADPIVISDNNDGYFHIIGIMIAPGTCLSWRGRAVLLCSHGGKLILADR